MDWVERLNGAIGYIEEHLTENIEYEELAKLLCCSTYQFQRMFAFMNDVSLSEYIRRRKLSLAAADIQNGGRITDIALKYGYSSPTAFSRAFQNLHGVTPSQAKKKGVALKTFPPLHFQLSITGTEELTYRIEDIPSFRVTGISMPLAKSMEENFQTVPLFWDAALQNGTLTRLMAMKKDIFDDLLGITVCGDHKDWRYYIAVAASSDITSGFEETVIPASKWAVFSGHGTNLSLQELERRVVTQWLPSSGYQYGNAPDIERYLQADPQDAVYEYWLSIQSKKE